MTALAVIEDFDVVEDFGSGVGSAGKIASVDQFQFEGAPEAFHCSVVVAVTASAHGGDQTGRLQGCPKVPGGVLNTPVGVKKQSGWRRTMQGRHGESCQDQSGVDCLAHGPADDFATMEVQYTGEIEPTLVGENVGDISDPDLVGSSGLWCFCQQIRSYWVIVVTIGGLDSVAALLAPTDALALHESGNSVPSMSMPKVMEFVDNSGRTVSLAAFGVDDRDLLNQCLIRQGTGPWTLTSPIPVVEPAGRNLEVAAKHRDGMVGSHCVNPFVAFPDGSERMPNVFFRMSRCSCKWRISRRAASS